MEDTGCLPVSILLTEDQSKMVMVPSFPVPITDSGIHRAKTIWTKEIQGNAYLNFWERRADLLLM